MRDCLEQGSFLPSRIQQGYKEGRSRGREICRHSTTHLKEIIISTDTPLYNIRRPIVAWFFFQCGVVLLYIWQQNEPLHLAVLISLAQVFFLAAAFAFAAFFLLLLIITIPINVPTTAEPSSARITGMRMAQTRGGKKSWRGWPGSTKG